jgi:hypothetical protein
MRYKKKRIWQLAASLFLYGYWLNWPLIFIENTRVYRRPCGVRRTRERRNRDAQQRSPVQARGKVGSFFPRQFHHMTFLRNLILNYPCLFGRQARSAQKTPKRKER